MNKIFKYNSENSTILQILIQTIIAEEAELNKRITKNLSKIKIEVEA